MYWVDILKQCLLFENLDDEEIKKVLRITKEVHFRKDQVVFERGQVGDSLFIILEGAVKISIKLDDEEDTLVVLDRGFHFGEMALIDESPRSATVTTVEESKLLVIGKRSYDKVLSENIGLEIKVLRNLANAFTASIRNINSNLAHLRFTLRQEYMTQKPGDP
ncbi:cyclic nucleotide-binding domain-containing protein [bacterium]|nr:cyclic nucleotide-binding domain-containing protein [bacterium]